ncbi:uncharacterized protein SPSK_07711 [Sporothrix schenckii 1099-18]|uniref:Mitochondrial K+-H+ exchange-related-domain-containing protein n=1 Tax=Sporothrix schenckii 1099-18 TaxID=1397361 RepID=A0A0F2MIB6_SPOSC|nr:uncharacterized protein SPSK_07711 [Sporothrix schenckii 1099-18]KJR88804.1 hypothetical protein SPSK_07711 [Sporothrix schenckii 1099-18]
MRLFLLPISTRRTLFYCERLTEPLPHQMSLMDKVQNRAAKMWSGWEKKPPGSLMHRIVSSGNAGLRRIAFEEWGLKSVPPHSARKRMEEAAARAIEEDKENKKNTNADGVDTKDTKTAVVKGFDSKSVQVVYPSSVIPSTSVEALLTRLGTEREDLHRKRLIWCFVGMPITAPFVLVPVIPNIPFFYLAYRAWSHWRALSGSKHIQHLLANKGLVYTSSPILDAIYDKEKSVMGETKPVGTQIRREADSNGSAVSHDEAEPERLLLSNPSGSKGIADAFNAPSLELELERAIWQVETALAKERGVKGKNEEETKQEGPDANANVGIETTKRQTIPEKQQPTPEQWAGPPDAPAKGKDKAN